MIKRQEKKAQKEIFTRCLDVSSSSTNIYKSLHKTYAIFPIRERLEIMDVNFYPYCRIVHPVILSCCILINFFLKGPERTTALFY